MQVSSDMGAFHQLLRSHSHLLHFSRLKLHPPHPPPSILLTLNSHAFHSTHHHQYSSQLDTPTPTNPPNAEPKPPQTWSLFNSNTNPHITNPTPLNAQLQEPNSVTEVDSQPDYPSKLPNYGVMKNVGVKGKVPRAKVHYVCTNCGHTDGQWWGVCRSCQESGTMKKFSEPHGGGVTGYFASDKATRSWLPEQKLGGSGPVKLSQVQRGMNHFHWRIRLAGTFGDEVARVLGGGVVPGSLVLVGGDPGVGKSTLSLQIAALIAESCDGGAGPVVYISGEESIEQIGNRADRLSIETEELYLYSSTDIEDIVEKVQLVQPRAVIIDSVQTIYLKGVIGSPGGMAQVKECTAALVRFSKRTNIPVFLIGHVNKDGDLAGPRTLEHIVDVVLYMEGEKHSCYRLLRSVKNRFGSTDELGVLEMSESGLRAVLNPSEIFLSEEHSDSEHLAGLAVAAIVDGSRTFLIEVQALCVPETSAPKHVTGVPPNRAAMIISVLKKQAGLKIENSAIFLNVVSGVTLTETAGDLAVAAAICSSFLELPIPNHVAFIGEIGLAGELRMVPRMDKRVSTLAKLGYKKCIVPMSAVKTLAGLGLEGIEIVGCKNLKQVIDKVFTQR